MVDMRRREFIAMLGGGWLRRGPKRCSRRRPLFTRAQLVVRFERGEPFCHIFPMGRGSLEQIEPEMRRLSEAPEIERQHKQWSASRDSFNADLRVAGSQATQERWQKMYFRGLGPAGEPTSAEGHRSRIRLKPFADTD
jgi:hypothetical protein